MLTALLVGALVRAWFLGRGQRFRIPAGWVNRLGGVALLVLAAAAGFGLYMIHPDADLRKVNALLDKPAADLTFLQVADDAPK
ncbi:MAG TPA: hypothetical protein VE078_02040, partial [Thermoanaerobaculia bacterium]|nr:hypothetical protein [Thermoanaerobaculia bacterium]